MAKPTHDDAMVMLQLMQVWPAEASNWIWSDEFTPDYGQFVARHGTSGDEPHRVRAVLNHYETIGTLLKHGLLNEDLLFDWLAVGMVWDRLKSYALAWREEMGSSHMYENFEAAAEAQRAWTAAREGKAA